MRQLEDRVAIITGGATGIGRASAVAFAAEGAAVVIGDVNAPEGERTVAEISEQEGRALFVETDVSSPDACRALVRRATDAFGRLDIMHANAGIALCRAVWDTSDDE